MTDNKRLYDKFTVIDNRTGDRVQDQTFTLIPSRDPAARIAVQAYADTIEADNPDLAADLRQL